jgi:outer-membrane receptor for ferric coprogen and ferric-rhodotorulic acid
MDVGSPIPASFFPISSNIVMKIPKQHVSTPKPMLASLTLALCALANSQLARADSEQMAEHTSEPTTAILTPVVVSSESEVQHPTEKTNEYTVRKVSSVTGLTLSPRETPQSVSTVTRAQLDDYKLNSVNDSLSNVTGVNVEKVETDRTYYTSRGFDITNFQTDGIGMPFPFGLVDGDLDTALFDRVEILRGANGLMSGTGNPSATINFVRKRPTATPQASVGLSYGSWNNRRLDVDVSNALNANKTLRGRFIAALQDKDSYLDRYSAKRTVLSGILEGDINDTTTLTGGLTYQRNAPKGGMWGALPMYYSDGSATHYSRSASTSADWSNWSVENRSAFAELAHHFGNDWQSTTTVTHTDTKEHSTLFYVYGTPDRNTGEGLYSYPSQYDMRNHQDLADTRLSGPFELAGRQHQAIIGANFGRSRMWEESAYGQGIGTALTDQSGLDGSYPEPSFDASYSGAVFKDTQRSVYATTRLSLADPLKLILGATNTHATSTGESYGVSHDRNASDTTPYVGIIYDLTSSLSAYASYAGIFTPQYQLDSQLKRLDPAKGNNKEVGLKAEFLEKRLNAGFALFNAHQKNLATDDGYVGTTAVYKGVDTKSQGYELSAEGAVTKALKITAGYTGLTIKDQDGNDTRTFSPRHSWNLATTWQVTDPISIGARIRWQGDIHRDTSSSVVIRQDAYALLDLMARYQITKNWSAALNLYNVTDKKYINSLYWEQAYYGAPINGSVSLNWKY